MTDTFDPKITDKPPRRCAECDRVMEHYNVWFGPTNETRVICWECKSRQEKGFFAHRGYGRGARTGYIPR